jgi:hypothetical protein
MTDRKTENGIPTLFRKSGVLMMAIMPEKPIEPPQYIDFKGGPAEAIKRMEIGGDVFGYDKKVKAWERSCAAALENALPVMNPSFIRDEDENKLISGELKELVWDGGYEIVEQALPKTKVMAQGHHINRGGGTIKSIRLIHKDTNYFHPEAVHPTEENVNNVIEDTRAHSNIEQADTGKTDKLPGYGNSKTVDSQEPVEDDVIMSERNRTLDEAIEVAKSSCDRDYLILELNKLRKG